jgi:hypothetical protein
MNMSTIIGTTMITSTRRLSIRRRTRAYPYLNEVGQSLFTSTRMTRSHHLLNASRESRESDHRGGHITAATVE